MSAYPKFRDLHLYAGLLLGLPLVVIALTGVLLNHAGLLGLKRDAPHKTMHAIPSPRTQPTAAPATHAVAFPGEPGRTGKSEPAAGAPQVARSAEEAARSAEDTSSFTSRPGGWHAYASDLDAALAAAGALWGDVPLERIELKHEAQRGMVVKIKAAHDERTSDREIVWSVSQGAIVGGKGPPLTGKVPIDWQRLVHDLHTGKIFSHTYGYWWSDAAGVALVLLGMTGGVLYAIPLLKKRQKRRGASSPVHLGLPRHPAADAPHIATNTVPVRSEKASP